MRARLAVTADIGLIPSGHSVAVACGPDRDRVPDRQVATRRSKL